VGPFVCPEQLTAILMPTVATSKQSAAAQRSVRTVGVPLTAVLTKMQPVNGPSARQMRA